MLRDGLGRTNSGPVHNTPLQTDERRALIIAELHITIAPLAAERQKRYAEALDWEAPHAKLERENHSILPGYEAATGSGEYRRELDSAYD